MKGELEQDFGNKDVQKGKLKTPYQVEPDWSEDFTNLSSPMREAIDDIGRWFKLPWSPKAFRIGPIEQPSLEVAFGYLSADNKPQMVSTHGLFGRFFKTSFLDLNAVYREPNRPFKGGGTLIMDNIWTSHRLFPSRVGPFKGFHWQASTEPEAPESRIAVKECEVQQFSLLEKYYGSIYHPTTNYIPSRFIVDVVLEDTLAAQKRPIETLEAEKQKVDAKLTEEIEKRAEAIERLSNLPLIYN